MKNTKTNIQPGTILRTSWGYNMTINNYCIVKEVSKTGKTINCKMLETQSSGDKSLPTDKEFGDMFRLQVRGNSFVGSYPFCNGDKRKGYFSEWNGKSNYQNTWD